MLRKMMNIRVLVPAVLVVVLAAAAVFGYPLLQKRGFAQALIQTGFTNAAIGNVKGTKGGTAYGDIALDRSSFSSIESATIQTDKDGKTLSLDKLVLTADWKQNSVPDIEGWTKPASLGPLVAALKDKGIKRIALNGGQMDVAVPVFGLVRLEAKGDATILDDGSLRMQGTLWSVQKQLNVQLRFNGEIAPTGLASFDVEITEGKIALPDFVATRVGGWVITNREATGKPWQISTQIVAGMMQTHALIVNGITMSIEGNTTNAAMTLQGGSSETDRTAISLESKINRNGNDSLNATLYLNDRTTVLSYAGAAEQVSGLLKNGTLLARHPNGVTWMRAVLRAPDTGKNNAATASNIVPNSGADLDIQNAQMGPLVRFTGISDVFKVSGPVTGLLPIRRVQGGGFTIDHGLLRSAGGGTVTLDSDTLPDRLTSTTNNTADLLENFAYDTAEIFVIGKTSEATLSGRPVVKAKGKSKAKTAEKSSQVKLTYKIP